MSNASTHLQRVSDPARGPLRLALAALLLAAGVGTAVAQDDTALGERDPKAIEALSTMGTYLRSLKTFALHVDATIDEVLTNGQKVQFGGTVNYTVQSPNRLRADVRSDRRDRQYFYDGKTLTQFSPGVNFYATMEAPATISATLQAVNEKYGLELPLSDLFFWGTDKSGVDDIKEAMVLAPSRIGGVECDHFAYRQESVDWQLWIARGKQPLPCKMVITTLDDAAQPQYVAVLKWNLTPTVGKATFAFVPPKGAKRIEIVPVAAAANN